MEADTGNGDCMYVKVGDVVRVRLLYSEVCMHMRVAGKPMNVQIVGDGTSTAAQLLRDDGTPFSMLVRPSASNFSPCRASPSRC